MMQDDVEIQMWQKKNAKRLQNADQPHPSHLPNRRNSSSTQSLLSFLSFSRSFSFFSLPNIDDPLEVRGRGASPNLGGEPDKGAAGLVDVEEEVVPWAGNARRYHPPA